MATTVLDMSMSVDGFIAGPNVALDNGLGDGGTRLHEWLLGPDGSFDERRFADLTDSDRAVYEELMSTGAVIAGRGTFEPAGGWGGDHHDGVPIFVLSRHPAPPRFADMPLVTYTPDISTAVGRARAAAGDGSILVHGSGAASMLLAAAELDEIQLHVVPVLLGRGRQLVDELHAQVELELMSSRQGAEALHLRYRVRYP
ncbi:dihydrofolate reductase family protein [Pseudactinotalea suaedae]|uniref:dihydrofolate reductase family protein n=1 Tax=Pseudactinotalea suaedae TaxID=1524924 RepID=UPI001F4F15D9|nr:dihydrofolate reductase family protein [Pseudactinotalea suaedae]